MNSIKVGEYSRSRSFHYDLILQDQASGERSQDQLSSGLFFVENERESRLYPMNSHQFSLVLLNIIAESSCFGLETIEFSRVLFLSCMSNQATRAKPAV